MLSFLKISNLAILDDVSLEPGAGLNVLTGETGAGKSIIVDALGLVLGDRGSSEMIRTGCDRLVIEAQMDLSGRPDAKEIFEAAGLDATADDACEDLVIRRELLAGGRGRAMINGQIVPLAVLKTLGEKIADLHGQHQHQSLLRLDGQRDALDRYAGAIDARRDVAARYERLRDLLAELTSLSGADRERSQSLRFLEHRITEIETVAPRVGEEEDLAREEGLRRHAEEILRLAGEALTMLSEDDDSVLPRLGGVKDRLSRLAAIDGKAAGLLALAEEARVAIVEIAAALAPYVDPEEHDLNRLEHVAARLSDLDRLKRTYGGSLESVLESLESAKAELAALGAASERFGVLPAEVDRARAEYLQAARRLSELRRRAAPRLAKAVESELAELAMEGARLAIKVEPDEQAASPNGIDVIEFLISANPGEEPRALSRVASGGELSRLMLGLRNVTDASADRRTLVFDEVDSGIGGRVAEVVGRRLAALSKRQQVLCVTHLPQIASLADSHFQVSKKSRQGRTSAEVRRLTDQERIGEVARMLGGAEGATARRHAQALISRRGRAESA